MSSEHETNGAYFPAPSKRAPEASAAPAADVARSRTVARAEPPPAPATNFTKDEVRALLQVVDAARGERGAGRARVLRWLLLPLGPLLWSARDWVPWYIAVPAVALWGALLVRQIRLLFRGGW
jgi:hypothetical protein